MYMKEGGKYVEHLCVGLVAATLAVFHAGGVRAESQGQTPSIVTIASPSTMPPQFGPPPFDAKGSAVHRPVISQKLNGARFLDIGYNTYKKGTELATPYAYTTDEYCFLPSGRVLMKNEGESFDLVPGEVMWRPAGAVTRYADVLEDTVSICAMAPARQDATSYRISTEDVGRWAGDWKAKPVPHYYVMAASPMVTPSDKLASSGVVEHEVVSERKDGSARASVLYITLDAGAHLALSSVGEHICWVDTGQLRLTWRGSGKSVAVHTFFYQPEGSKIDEVKAIGPSSIVCFTAPAAL